MSSQTPQVLSRKKSGILPVTTTQTQNDSRVQVRYQDQTLDTRVSTTKTIRLTHDLCLLYMLQAKSSHDGASRRGGKARSSNGKTTDTSKASISAMNAMLITSGPDQDTETCQGKERE